MPYFRWFRLYSIAAYVVVVVCLVFHCYCLLPGNFVLLQDICAATQLFGESATCVTFVVAVSDVVVHSKYLTLGSVQYVAAVGLLPASFCTRLSSRQQSWLKVVAIVVFLLLFIFVDMLLYCQLLLLLLLLILQFTKPFCCHALSFITS